MLFFEVSSFSFLFKKLIKIPIINFAKQGDISNINNSINGIIFSKFWERQYSLIIIFKESN